MNLIASVVATIVFLWAVVSTQAFATLQSARTIELHASPSSSHPSLLTSFPPLQPGVPNVCYSSSVSTRLSALAIDKAQEGSWKAFLDDEETGIIFYYNEETGESVWEPPTTSFPKVRLNRWMEEKVVDLRNTYLENLEKDRWGVQELLGNIMKPFQNEDKVMDTRSDAKGAPRMNPTMPFSGSIQGWNQVSKAATKEEPIVNSKSKDDGIKPFIDDMVKSMSSFDIFEDNPFKEMVSVLSQNKALATQNEVSEVSLAPDVSKKGGLYNDGKVDSLSLQQRTESTKTGLVGLLAGGSAIVPFNFMRDFFADSFYSVGETVAGGVESALFAVVYRYCVRDGEEKNEELVNIIAGAFVVTRAISMTTGWDDGAIDFLPPLLWNGLESFVMFHVARNAVEFMANKGLIERMK